MGGFPIVIIDTAGFRSTLDTVERMGIQRSKERIRRADLIIWLSESDHAADDFVPGDIATIKVRTKCDLLGFNVGFQDSMSISASTGEGVPELVSCIIEKGHNIFRGHFAPGVGFRPTGGGRRRGCSAYRTCVAGCGAARRIVGGRCSGSASGCRTCLPAGLTWSIY